MGLADMSRECGLPKATSLRLLRSLVDAGIAVRDDTTGRYLQNPALWIRLAPFLGPAQALIANVVAVLGELSREGGATALVMLPEERRRRCMFPIYVYPPAAISVDPAAGGPLPLHALAAGKSYLAHLPPDELADYMNNGLTRLTERTITSPGDLSEELAAVRRNGYAMNLGEIVLGLPGIGVPLRDGDGAVVGGLSLAYAEIGHTKRFLLDRLPALNQASEAISRLLTYDAFRAYMKDADPRVPVPPPESDAASGETSGNGATVVRSVVRAARLLSVLWHSERGETASALARQRGLDQAAVSRLLHTLVAQGVVRRHAPNGRYHLHPVYWLRIAATLRTATSLGSTVEFVLERLAHYSGATAMLVCGDTGSRRAVVAAHAFPPRHVFYRPDPGFFPLLHSAASGKCLLASEPACAVSAYIRAGLGKETEHTITAEEQLLRELNRIRKCGYAISKQESVLGSGGVAVPVIGSGGQTIAAVTLAPTIYELTAANVKRWVPQLRVAAETFSRVLTSDWRTRCRSRGPATAAAFCA